MSEYGDGRDDVRACGDADVDGGEFGGDEVCEESDFWDCRFFWVPRSDDEFAGEMLELTAWWGLECGRGFAMDFGPDGRPLVEALGPGEGGLLYAEVELKTIDVAKQMTDVVGHYSRPDLLSLLVNPEEERHATMR